MKKSKRLILVLLICIFTVVSLFLIACDKDPDTPDDPNKPSVDNPNDPDNPTPPPLDPDDPHDHSFTTWGHDDTNHWKVCSLCGAKDDSTVAAHKYSGTWTVSKEANCTEKGIRERSCECGAKEIGEINIDPTKHEYDESNLIEDIPATCKQEGKGHYICKHDPTHFSEYVTIPVDSTKHRYDDNNWKQSKPATCSAPGEEQNICANGCGTTITKEIPKLEHNFEDAEWTTDERFGGKLATCKTLGTKVRFCVLCYDAKETAPTDELDPNNHEYSREYTNVDKFSHRQVATCGCKDAKDRVTRHSYVARGNNVECDLCNFKGTSHSNDANIEYDETGGVTHILPSDKSGSTVIIPAVQGGKVVTTLGPGIVAKTDSEESSGLFKQDGKPAFRVDIQCLVIPYTITLAKEGAFATIPTRLWSEGGVGVFFEGTPNNLDDIDMGHYIEVIKNNGKETPVERWSSRWTVDAGSGGWANNVVFYSEKNPYNLTLEEQIEMGIVNSGLTEKVDLINNTNNNVYKYHLNFRPQAKPTPAYRFRFWHWNDEGKPVLWSESDVDDSDKDKGNHATTGADAYYSSETYRNTSVSTLRGIHSAPSSDLIVLPRYVNNKMLGIIKDRAFNPTDCSSKYSESSWFEDDLQSSIMSFSKYVLPDTLMSIGELAFKNSTSGSITIYFEGSLDIWKTISISDGNDDLNNAITGGRFYLYSYEDPKTLTDNPLPTEWQRSESQTISLKYWHWSNDQPTPW